MNKEKKPNHQKTQTTKYKKTNKIFFSQKTKNLIIKNEPIKKVQI